MRILIPGAWSLPDRISGELPKIIVDNTTDTWLDIMSYWNGLGYVSTSVSGQEIVLEYDSTKPEKNGFIRAVWAKELCNVSSDIHGDIEGWAAVWMLNTSTYDEPMPEGIPNNSYVDETDPENPVTVRRRWDQWGDSNHNHYYVEEFELDGQTITNKIMIPCWSWGTNILGTEMSTGQQVIGVNLIDRDNFQKTVNQGAAVPIPIQVDGEPPYTLAQLRELGVL